MLKIKLASLIFGELASKIFGTGLCVNQSRICTRVCLCVYVSMCKWRKWLAVVPKTSCIYN